MISILSNHCKNQNEHVLHMYNIYHQHSSSPNVFIQGISGALFVWDIHCGFTHGQSWAQEKKQVVAGSYISIYIYPDISRHIHTDPYRSIQIPIYGSERHSDPNYQAPIWYHLVGTWSLRLPMNCKRGRDQKVIKLPCKVWPHISHEPRKTHGGFQKKGTPKKKDDYTGKSHLRIYTWITTGGTPMTCRKPPHLLFDHIPLTHSARSRGYWFLSAMFLLRPL